MTETQMESMTRFQLGDPTEAAFPTSLIQRYLNEGQQATAARIPEEWAAALLVIGTINTSIGDGLYDLPAAFARIVRVTYKVGTGSFIQGQRIMPEFWGAIDSNAFMASSAAAPKFRIYGGGTYTYQIEVSPLPTTANTPGINIEYYKIATDMATWTSAASCALPVQYHDGVVMYAVARGLQQLGQIDRAQQMIERYESLFPILKENYLYDREARELRAARGRVA